MADSTVPVTAGSGTNIDTRTESTNGNHRQVVVLGDPATNAGVAPVDVTHGVTVQGGIADNGVDSGNPLKVGGKYNSTPPTYANGDRADLQTDVNGNLLVSSATKIAGEDLTNDVLKTEQRYSYYQITADTQIKSGAGFIHALIISASNLSGYSGGIITLYDSLTETGTKIWQGYVASAATYLPVSIIIDASFATGLYVGYGSGVANTSVTISYR